MSALDTQQGGTHYKDMPIQPVTFCMENKLDYCQSNVIKYICRFRNKGGKQDLLKAKHYIDILWESEYGGQAEMNETFEKQFKATDDRQITTGLIYSSQKIGG